MGCTAYGGVAPTSFWGRANGGTRHESWGDELGGEGMGRGGEGGATEK